MNPSELKAIKIWAETKLNLEELEIETTWVKLKTFDDKINFLLWFYWSHKNNNWNHKY